MNVCIVGTGYVGLVSGACLAELGHRVICVDSDPKKIALLKARRCHFYEPDLEPLVAKHVAGKRLSASQSIREGVAKSEIIFICVNTPPRPNGEADLSFVENVSRQIAAALTSYRLIVSKSTVPVETGRWIKRTIELHVKKGVSFDVAANPEFLSEGTSVRDFMVPDRIVLGVESPRAEKLLRELYAALKAPILVTDIESAELIKHASNTYLATKISFANSLSQLCDAVGADVRLVAEGLGLDHRIGRDFLNAGVGFGGSCFPKDLAAFIRIGERRGIDLKILGATREINERQKLYFLKLIQQELWNLSGKRIAVLGLSFKPDTDDMRFAPSCDVIEALQREGAEIVAYDPVAMEKAKAVLKGVRFAKDAYQCAKGADAVVLVTEWKEFQELDLKRLRKGMTAPYFFDGRNVFEPEDMARAGFRYVGVGRGRTYEPRAVGEKRPVLRVGVRRQA